MISSPVERHLRADEPGIAALRDQRHATCVGPARNRLHLRHVARHATDGARAGTWKRLRGSFR